MSKLSRIVAAAGLAALMGGAVAPSAVAASSNERSYECVNWGGGPDHKVDCSDFIDVGGVNIGNVNVVVFNDKVLSDNQITVLEKSLNNVEVNVVDLTLYLKNLEVSVINAYKSFNIVLSAANIKTCATDKKVCV
ncbi:hypothetical protein RND61_03190 [Streptomyces sp. TRM76323]|uniref:Uncharacterized protein n=1 Tax=Streptomyces tamarix TaxID=3078565 RepID=A0ABU3QE93_9ACTN|nr:hypothetical protein [Streptomyces tamarix]MDT9681084.1 hypothetical protein [Streptomyces tamarix]